MAAAVRRSKITTIQFGFFHAVFLAVKSRGVSSESHVDRLAFSVSHCTPVSPASSA